MEGLCDVCASVDWRRILIQWRIDDESPWDYCAQHYATSKALRQAAASGCKLCSLILDADGRGPVGLAAERIATDEIRPFFIRATQISGSRHPLYATPNNIGRDLRHESSDHERRPTYREVPLTRKSATAVDNGPDYNLVCLSSPLLEA